MTHAKADILCVMPCDSPLIRAGHLTKLIDALLENKADIAVAYDGERIHPVFLALKTSLQSSLKSYLQQGDRKIDLWLFKHHVIKVDFSDEPDVFLNINTLSELNAMEHQHD